MITGSPVDRPQIVLDGTRVLTRLCRAENTGRYRFMVLEGSTRSSKTWSIIQFLIARTLRQKQNTTIARKRLIWAKETVLPDFLVVMEKMGIFRPSSWSKTESLYTFPNQSTIGFLGLDEPQKIHGRKQDDLWINEAIQTGYDDFRQLNLRTKGLRIFDYNPSETDHWIYDDIIPRSDCCYIHSTYKDNHFLTPSEVAEIEALQRTDPIGWQIYGLGNRAAREGLIFRSARQCDAFPAEARKVCYGLDFGFVNDPTALVKVGTSGAALILHEIIYETGLVNTINRDDPRRASIEQRLIDAGINKHDLIVADSSEPKSIAEIRARGWNIVPSVKGTDSVRAGLLSMQKWEVTITKTSTNLLKEKNNYSWKADPNGKGKFFNQPEDRFNHGFDAARYAYWYNIAVERMPAMA